MKKLAYITLLSSFLFTASFGCGNGSSNNENNDDIPAIRSYLAYNIGNGDLFNLVINDDTSAMSYNNYSTDATASANFTTSNGLMETDNENFSSIYESPLVGLVINSTESLSLATSDELFTLDDLVGASYNTMQFRNQIGGHGIEISCAVVDSAGIMQEWYYRPGEEDVFGSGTTDLNEMPVTQDGNFMSLVDEEGGTVYFFGANDFYVFAIPNGPNFMFVQEAESAFNSGWSGNYHTMLYINNNASMMGGDTETGTVTFGDGTAHVSTSGEFTLTMNGVTESHALIPMSSSSFVGAGKIENSCNGMFTFQTNGGADVFISFVDQIFLFASYQQIDSGTYSYKYGMGTLIP